MGWNRRTQAIVLAGGLLTWGGAISWRATQPAPSLAGGKSEAKAEPGRRQPVTAAAPPALRLDLLDRPLPALTAEGKNLFASVLPPPPAPPKPAPAAAAPPPPDPFLEEARRLRVVAIMQENGQDTAFIAEGNEVYNVKKNDVIRSRFLVKDVKDDAVVVSLPNGEKEVRLGLAPSAGAGQR